MKIIFGRKQYESPIAKVSVAADEARAANIRNFFGAFSIQTFAAQGSLSHTHEDAQGWLNYLSNFSPANFWYKDGNVRVWAYYETYDDWMDTYGWDAVLGVYHSGHGGMDSNGLFFAPMGADWGGLGVNAFSNQMGFGEDHANYAFWSTCSSLRVLDGQNPIRTWFNADKGFRMLFGFETTSYDDPNYGQYFWDHWNMGKSFSTAWLDASWQIAHDQAPSAVACGSTPDEARDRVFNERLMYWNHVSNHC